MEHLKIRDLYLSYPIGTNIPAIRRVIREFKKGFRKLKVPKNKIINLWCRGSSGAILASAFALSLSDYECIIAHVKKDGEESHGGDVSGFHKLGYNIVIDDFISTGDTIKAILEIMDTIEQSPEALMITEGWRKMGEETINKFKFIISE